MLDTRILGLVFTDSGRQGEVFREVRIDDV